MKKLFQWLTGSVVKEIGNAIDKLTTTEEEKLIIKKQVQEILEQADNNAQIQVTDRWKSDMASDSYLSKNIRPVLDRRHLAALQAAHGLVHAARGVDPVPVGFPGRRGGALPAADLPQADWQDVLHVVQGPDVCGGRGGAAVWRLSAA